MIAGMWYSLLFTRTYLSLFLDVEPQKSISPIWFACDMPYICILWLKLFAYCLFFPFLALEVLQIFFYFDCKATFHLWLHLKFIEYRKPDDMSLVFNLFRIFSLIPFVHPLRRKANISSILDSLFTWDPVVIPGYFFPIFLGYSRSRGEGVNCLTILFISLQRR